MRPFPQPPLYDPSSHTLSLTVTFAVLKEQRTPATMCFLQSVAPTCLPQERRRLSNNASAVRHIFIVKTVPRGEYGPGSAISSSRHAPPIHLSTTSRFVLGGMCDCQLTNSQFVCHHRLPVMEHRADAYTSSQVPVTSCMAFLAPVAPVEPYRWLLRSFGIHFSSTHPKLALRAYRSLPGLC